MSEYYGEQTDFIFDAQVLGEEKALSRSDWAATVFGDPLVLPPRLQANWSPQLDEINEASLYNDWQTRDTVFGHGLLEPRIAQLNLAIQSFRAGIVRRQRAISMMRARLESIERINQAEPNPALKYPEDVIASMKHDLAEVEQEYAYLRNSSGRLASLAMIVDKMSETSERAGQALPEQLFRLIGLSWKGRAKVCTFRLQSPHLGYQIEQTPGIPLRYKLPGTVVVDGVDLMLDEDVVSYLLHCLETIAALASETSTTLFDARKRKQHLTEGWPPAMVMLRAIVELFYFCSFELPYTFPAVFLDRNATERILIYEEKNGQWQTITDEHPGSRLKRQAAEVVSLLTLPPSFLNCANPDDLSKYCRPSIAAESKQKPSQYQSYSSVGLAHLSCDPRSNIYKFHSGYDLTAQLLDQLIAAQPELSRTFHHEDGPLSTLLALASFDLDVFKRNFDAEPDDQFSDNDRFALLGRFWRLLGKQRPLTLLGNDYAKTIYKGMEAMGEAPPERSSLLSVHLSSIISPTMLGKGMTQIENPLGGLKLGDQIRLVELLNVSWIFTADCFGCLLQVTDNRDLGDLLKSTIGSPENEKKLAINTNRKWINDQQSIWTLIRSTAPVAWDFWVRLVEKVPIQSILSRFDTEGTLNYMFQLSADLVRLMLLFETCDPVMAERISTDAETAGREMLSTFALYEQFPMLSERMHYYFEPEIEHDRWLAFVVSFKKHLEEIVNNLEKAPGGKSQLEMVKAAITQLDTKYPETAVQDISSLYSFVFLDTVPLGDFSSAPDPQVVTEKPAPAWAVSPDMLPAIDEATAQSIETVCRQLIGMRVFQLGKLPEIVVLSRLPGMADEMQFLAKGAETLRRGLDDRLSMLIFSSPRTVRDVSRLFRQYCPGGGSNVIGEQFWPPLKDYLNKVEPFNNYVKQMLGQSAIFEEGIRVRFSQAVFDRSERVIDFFLFSILGSIYCHLGSADDRTDRVSTIQGFIQSRVGEALSGWEPEVLLLGGGRLRCSNGQAVLFGSERENPHFSEPERPASARLLWYGLRMRFEIALRIFRSELHGADFTVEI